MNIKILSNRIFVLIFSIFVSTNVYSQGLVVEGMSIDRLNNYSNYIDKEIANGDLPGVVSLVYRNGKEVYRKTAGYSDAIEKTPMSSDGRFYIQSMTKPIITAAFMMLYEEGYFLLTDPVSKYIPAFKNLKVALDPSKGKGGDTKPLEREITIAHLLTHTSGLSHGLGGSELDKDYAKAMYYKPHKSIQDRMNAMLELPLMFQPGTSWYYSAAPDVLSVLIKQFTGVSTAQFLQQRIFDPLEMNSTGYNISAPDQGKMVKVHTMNESGELIKAAYQPPMQDVTVWSGVNGLYSSAEDYAKFCHMLLNKGKANGKQLLGRKTIELMTTNNSENLRDKAGESFGLGFAIVENPGESHLLGSVGTFYWSGANNTHFFIDPKENIVAVFMTQIAPYSDRFHEEMRRYVLQALVD
jgi:CubicO group peptidase (beta-lactamase class C family)